MSGDDKIQRFCLLERIVRKKLTLSHMQHGESFMIIDLVFLLPLPRVGSVRNFRHDSTLPRIPHRRFLSPSVFLSGPSSFPFGRAISLPWCIELDNALKLREFGR